MKKKSPLLFPPPSLRDEGGRLPPARKWTDLSLGPLLFLLLTLTFPSCRQDVYNWEEPASAPVRAEVVRRRPFRPTIPLLGVVRPPESIPITAPAEGTLAFPSRFAAGLATGVHVRRGETLCFIENDRSRHDVESAQLRLESIRADLLRVERAYAAGLEPEERVARLRLEVRVFEQELATAERSAKRLEVTAPRDGSLVVATSYAAGTNITSGTTLAEVAASGAPRIEAWAGAADRAELRPGLDVSIRRPGSDVAVGKGRIEQVAGQVDDAGTLRVVASASGENLPLAGEGVEMDVLGSERAKALTVPDDALVTVAGVPHVYLVDGRTSRRTAVVVIAHGGGRAEIGGGIEEGQQIVISDVQLLQDGGGITISKIEDIAGE